MLAAQGILTAGRQNQPCGASRPAVWKAGCGRLTDLRIDMIKRRIMMKDKVIREGDWIRLTAPSESVPGKTQTTIRTSMTHGSSKCCPGRTKSGAWESWANADYPRDAARAREYGAEGIGLCRSEHMFFETERLPFVQK